MSTIPKLDNEYFRNVICDIGGNLLPQLGNGHNDTRISEMSVRDLEYLNWTLNTRIPELDIGIPEFLN